MKLFEELLSSISSRIGEAVAKIMLSGNQDALLDDWDNAVKILDNEIDKFDSIDEPTAKDYIRLAVAYLYFSIYKSLEEKE
jgi:hypothetical protein